MANNKKKNNKKAKAKMNKGNSGGGSNKPKTAQVKKAPQGVRFTPQRAPPRSSGLKPHPLTSTVCSVTNPFCTHARGAKQLGPGGQPSVPWHARQMMTITTSAGGAATFVALPATSAVGYLNTNVAPGAAGTAGVIATTNLSTYLHSALFVGAASGSQVFNLARIVSWGIVFRVTCSMTDAAGFVLMNEVKCSDTAASGTVVTLATGSVEGTATRVEPIAAGREFTWISRCNPPECERYRVGGAATGGPYVDFGFTGLTLEIQGGPASKATITADLFFNFEALPTAENAVVSRLVTPPRPHNPAVAQAAQKVQSRISGFVSGGIDVVESSVAQAASQALHAVEDVFGSGLAMLGL